MYALESRHEAEEEKARRKPLGRAVQGSLLRSRAAGSMVKEQYIMTGKKRGEESAQVD
jgi:hypothetical protein